MTTNNQPSSSNGSSLFDYERSRVPASKTRGWFSLSAVFLGICVGIPPMILGSSLAAGMGFHRAFSAILWSSLIAMPICVLAAQVGTRSHLSTGMTLKFAFGSSGAKIISLIIALDMFCWAAMNMELFTDSLRNIGSGLAAHVSRPSLAIAAGALMIVVTIFGYQSIEKFAFLMVPALLTIVVAYFGYILHVTPIKEVLTRPAFGHPIEYATAISIIAGSYLNLSMLLPDSTRYSKGPIHSTVAVIIGLCVGLPLFVLMACYLSAATTESDFVRLMTMKGWASIVIVVVGITCWFHMNTSLYSASLNLAAIIRNTPKWKLTVVGGLVATSIALFGIVARYVHFLVFLSILIPPIAGVYTADYLLRRKIYEFGKIDDVEKFRPTAIFSLFVGVLFGFLTTGRQDFGIGAFHLTYLPAIDSYLTSFLLQFVLGKLLGMPDRSAERMSNQVEGD
jgi:cytosine permease